MIAARRIFQRRFSGPDQSGTAAIEFALMTPFLLILIGGVTEIGFAAYEAMQANAAVEAGILYAAANTAANGWNSALISSAETVAGPLPPAFHKLTATPAPSEFCGCPNAAGSVSNLGAPPCTPYSTACAGSTPAGTYVRVNASLTHFVLFPIAGYTLGPFTPTAVIRIQ